MSTKTNFIIVLVTTANRAEAEKISQTLLKEKLIACANIVNPVTSFFHWSGKVDKCEECLVVMKSRLDLFAELCERVKGFDRLMANLQLANPQMLLAYNLHQPS